MRYKRIGATGKGLTGSVLKTGGGRTEKFMGDAIRVGNKALPAGGSRAASTVGKIAKSLGGPVVTGIGLALTPRELGNGELPNPPKTPPNALDVSLSGAPSKAVGKGRTTPKASWKSGKSGSLPSRQVSTKASPEVKGQISQKNHVKMSPKMASSIPSTQSPAPVTSYDRPAQSSKKTGGFLKGLRAALTKKPTARMPSEYEQIMSDLQPSRKKKR